MICPLKVRIKEKMKRQRAIWMRVKNMCEHRKSYDPFFLKPWERYFVLMFFFFLCLMFIYPISRIFFFQWKMDTCQMKEEKKWNFSRHSYSGLYKFVSLRSKNNIRILPFLAIVHTCPEIRFRLIKMQKRKKRINCYHIQIVFLESQSSVILEFCWWVKQINAAMHSSAFSYDS